MNCCCSSLTILSIDHHWSLTIISKSLLIQFRPHQFPCWGICALQQGVHTGEKFYQNPEFDRWFQTQVLTPRVQEPEKKRQEGVVGPYGPPPLTLLFGWAGSTDKNLVKYSKIYLNQVLKCQCWNNLQYLYNQGLHHRPHDPPHQPHLQGDWRGNCCKERASKSMIWLFEVPHSCQP